jgi:fructose-1,6-bisphosphatase/inositol monophosphatase family enzyme
MVAVDTSFGHTDNKEYGNLMALTANGQVKEILYGSATYNLASLADGAGATTTVTVNGVALGDIVIGVSLGVDLQGILMTGYVSAANTVSVRFQNETAGTLDLASTTLRVLVADVT